MEIKHISIEETPEEFKQAVQYQLDLFAKQRPKILTIRAITNTPYIDKTIISTTYKAYLEVLNTMVVVSYDEISKPEWNVLNPRIDSFTIGDECTD